LQAGQKIVKEGSIKNKKHKATTRTELHKEADKEVKKDKKLSP
jgi:hypothetical protein